mgnify:CR=1 FL=1
MFEGEIVVVMFVSMHSYVTWCGRGSNVRPTRLT